LPSGRVAGAFCCLLGRWVVVELFWRLEPDWKSPVGRETLEGAMEIVFWVIVTIIVLAVVYVCALSFRKRKEALGREPSLSGVAPGTKEHGVDLQARRKTYDDVT